MTTETQSAPETGPISLDQFASMMTAEQEAAAKPPVEEEEEQPEAEAAAPEGDQVEEPEPEPELEVDAEEEEPEAPTEPIPDPPQSWSKEDREGWDALTPKAREVVLRREKERDTAVSQAVQKASEAVKAVQSLSERTNEIAHLAVTDFERRWGKGEEGTVDWVKLAQLTRQYPDQYDYASTRAQFEAERTELKRATAEASEQSALAQRAFLADEAQKLATLEPELVDADKGQTRRQKTFDHLEKRGFPKELFPNISALELSVAYDAMRWREAQANAKAAAAVPRKNPTAPASKVVRPSGDGGASPQRNLQALSQKLTKSGKLDDFVNLMNAEEEQRARKARR